MIIDLERFVAVERPRWERLEERLTAWEADPQGLRTMTEVREVERLYQRASADLARLATYAAEPTTIRRLEALVARGYVAIYGASSRRQRFRFWPWLVSTWPRTFRQHWGAFQLAAAVMLVGGIFGAGAMAFDERAKPILIGPFGHLAGDPSDRVRKEETRTYSAEGEAAFAGELMAHNTRVTFFSLALGMTAGVGTLVLVFFNGSLLGAVMLDYLRAGEGVFLAGWLLPHGVIEIPAILIGSQAGFVLAGALLGRHTAQRLPDRLRAVAPAVVTLAGGAALMLVWAGVVEALFSQRHKPVLPYAFKISFGVIEGLVLVSLLALGGRAQELKTLLARRRAPAAHEPTG